MNSSPQATPRQSGLGIIFFLFFISGFSALCYQIVWQRMLFAAFGINIESVTIIVSVFMLGLGVGGIVGGNLRHQPRLMLALFILFECSIGLFGFCSPMLIRWLGEIVNSSSLWAVGLGSYALFGIPTFLMGATLPILVSYVQSRVGLTGLALGWLYASNTFGAMFASGLTVTVLFAHFGQSDVVHIAVALNLLTALSAYLFYKTNQAASQQPEATSTVAETETAPGDDATGFSPRFLLWISFALGYITLSQELVWYRVLSFVTANTPETFGLLLAAFLLGIAFATISVCDAINERASLTRYIVITLALSTVAWFLALPAMAAVAVTGNKTIMFITGLLFVVATSYFTGGIFTALCQLLQQRSQQTAGKIVGTLYFVNVLGATLGPLLTGFLLFEYLSLRDLVLLLGGLLLVTGVIFVRRLSPQLAIRQKAPAMIGLSLVLGIGSYVAGYDHIMEKLQLSSEPFTAFNSNRSGFISIIGDRIYGNGAYDGKMNIDPENDTSTIIRAYGITNFHPNPKKILQIGMSGGSWTKIISMYAPLERLTTIEINKGYLDIAKQYPDHADILTHPKVNIVIDDGRHWLNNHPNEKFDVIVSNTIYHWRSNATNMISREFMELARAHLNPGGYIFMIDTGAEEVAYTAAHVFSFVSRSFKNMVIAGDTPSAVPPERKRSNLAQFHYPDGSPAYKNQATIDNLVNITYPNQREAYLARQDLMLITDDNMATEFKKKPH
ncbi:MAG: methyltransferase domain-containing protein [Alphaproteobacteria bacterium]|nr:methyltransferase domain-containing protein [Alphaproteobacteria bacterium]